MLQFQTESEKCVKSLKKAITTTEGEARQGERKQINPAEGLTEKVCYQS